MDIYLGVDIGAVGVKAALVMRCMLSESLEPCTREWGLRPLAMPSTEPVGTNGQARVEHVFIAPYRRTRGRPLEAVRGLIEELLAKIPADAFAGVAVTGSGSVLVAEALGVRRVNDFQAIARAMGRLHPAVRTVFEMGGETSKYIHLEPDPSGRGLNIIDYGTNGDCAAGTGAFLDQQAGRLKYRVEQIGEVVAEAERAAQIAGRCSVFAKSDMIHAQQKGFTPPEVLRGLCKAVATNYRSAVVKGRTPEPPVALLGGVSANAAVVRELAEAFDLKPESLLVPEAAESLAAAGAAFVAAEALTNGNGQPTFNLAASFTKLADAAGADARNFPASVALDLNDVLLLRDKAKPYTFPADGAPVDAYLGLDIGSVGTKLVVIDAQGAVIHEIFTRTEGRPIEVMSRALRELEAAVGSRVRIRGVGSTGSGRELIGELVGADAITDEITCHKTGATFVGDRLLHRRPDTIFEIGGQDSKYISLAPEGGESNDTVVVDFTMNEACAAGTGSFLEERAAELGVSIRGEFSQLALQSTAPIKLGERCTVFMERDVNTYMQRGAKREDVIAGLAYSVVYNYINRVVRGRPIGECVFFQGGTAYNDAVAAAFSKVCGKQVIVPPHNAVLGAIGAALVAREKVTALGEETRFRGFDLVAVDYTLKEFTCRGCGNTCSVQEFNVEGEKTYWGDKCSDRYRKRAKTTRTASIPDLVELRKELIAADDVGDPAGATRTIGIPQAMYTLDLLPLWRRFFRDCGFRVVPSDPTDRRTVRAGLDSVVAEPCFPIIVAHGHIADLVAKGVDYLFVPNLLSAATKFMDNESHVCPWGQTLPFVARQAPAFAAWADRILCPTLRFREGPEAIIKELVKVMAPLGVKPKVVRQAYLAGQTVQDAFKREYERAGVEAVEMLARTGEAGMVLIGRPYNIHDPGVNLSVARKLRDYYGVNVIPIDALPLAEIDIRDVNENMFWEYGRKILAAGKFVRRHPNLHLIYITNFKCGPDSFLKGFIGPASGKPFLALQFDGHSNDAGMMTRCEAYLDSKGILRWWRQSASKPETEVSKGGPSTSHKWPTPARV